MKALIPRAYYSDPDVFRAEQTAFFDGVWQLAGFASDLRQHDDYITVGIGQQSVVIQNFKGELHAFHNVCSHRLSRIRCEAQGNAPLRCQYHGWSYDQNGIPFSIPNRPMFESADVGDPTLLALSRWQVDTCNDLVFVRRSQQGPSLREFLQGAAPYLDQVGAAIAEKLGTTRMLVDANWKIVVENTLESYHASAVHSQTLLKLGVHGLDFRFDGPHSVHTSKPREVMNRTKEALYHAFRSRPMVSDAYIHQLVFPNATLAVSYGMTFNINQIRAVGPRETEIIVHVFMTKLGELEPREGALVRAMRPAIVELTNKIFLEDKAICEQVQLGMAEASRDAILSREEERIFRFQESYMQFMDRQSQGATV